MLTWLANYNLICSHRGTLTRGDNIFKETKLQPKPKRQIYIVIGVIIVALILIVSAIMWYFYLRPITFKEFSDRLTANKYKVGDVVKIRDKVDFVSIHKLPEMVLPTNWTDPHANISLKPNGEIITYTNVGFESTSGKEGDLIFTGDRRNDFQVGSEVEFSLIIKECDYAGTTRLGCEGFDNSALVVYYAIYQVWSGDYNVILDANVSVNGTVSRITVGDIKSPILGCDVENFPIADIDLSLRNNTTGIVYIDIPLDINQHTINEYTIRFFDADANGILSKEDYFIISNCQLNVNYRLELKMKWSVITQKSWTSI